MMSHRKKFSSGWISSILACALVVAGCGGGGKSGAPEPETGSPVKETAPGEYEWVMEVNDLMRFPDTRVEVPAGVTLTVRLIHVGQMSLEQMGHNWVLLRPDISLDGFAADASGAVDSMYIPKGWDYSILAHTDMIGSGQTTEVTFTTPGDPGEYPYICTFPGHFYGGMKGVLVVVE